MKNKVKIICGLLFWLVLAFPAAAFADGEVSQTTANPPVAAPVKAPAVVVAPAPTVAPAPAPTVAPAPAPAVAPAKVIAPVVAPAITPAPVAALPIKSSVPVAVATTAPVTVTTTAPVTVNTTAPVVSPVASSGLTPAPITSFNQSSALSPYSAPASNSAPPMGFGGSLMRTEATGYGAVYFLENMLVAQNEHIDGKIVLVSGAGNVSLHAAEKAHMLGGVVVTVSDSQGTLYDEKGLNQEKINWLKEQKAKSQPLADYVAVYGGEWFAGQKPWHIKGDIAIPSATQNEVNEDDAKLMVENGIKYVVEGANMPLTAEAIDHIRLHRVHYAPGKAANAGGVAVSGLEMSQNSVRQYKTFEEIDARLKAIMKNIHDGAVEASEKYHQTDKGYIDYMTGANIVGFKRVADALVAYGVLN